MRNSLKALFTAVTILVVTTFLIACGSPAANNTAANNASPANTSTPATTASPANTTDSNAAADADKKDDAADTAAADKIGVAECDDYIAKYEACLSKNVPAAQRATYEATFKTMRESYATAASTEAGKSGLAATCKTALETTKAAMSSFNCEW